MEKNMELINVYLKIHQKRDLSIDDLKCLARYDPECFEKTCHNVVYNIPQAKPVLLPATVDDKRTKYAAGNTRKNERRFVDQILEKLKHLEKNEIPPMDVEIERVKNLLGNFSENKESPVPSGIAAVIATTFSFFSAISTNFSPKIAE